jgi:hypothetical protein
MRWNNVEGLELAMILPTDGLVFVACQLAQEKGKMKGSTKSQKMDEPFNM